MKGMNFFILASGCILTAALASCTSIDEPVPEPSSSPIGFSPAVNDANTRYASDDLPATMGVFAYLTEGSGFNASTSTPNFMYNQLVTRNGTAWSYTPVKYWPTNANDKVSFFAYAPHNANGLTPCSNTQKGYPSFTYTVPAAEASQEDLLVSAPLLNQNGGEIAPVLKHALTKITFNVKSEMKLKVTSLTVNKASSTATLTFKDGGFDWGSYTGTQTFTATLSGGGTEVAADTTKAQKIATFFLLPNKASATFSITYLQDGETVSINKTDVALPLTWTQGGSVSYMIKVKKDGISVTAVKNNEWSADSSGEEALTSKELAPGYKATDLKLGDYYYSDGTTSDGGYRKYADGTTAILNILPRLTDKDGNARSVVAIVFYAGKHLSDTGDYSTTGISTSTFHGYAVALRNVGRVAWCNKSGSYLVGTSAVTGDWQGFYNQQQIENYVTTNSADGWTMGNFPAANGCKNYTPSAPAKSSGWFHPSAGQQNALGANKNILNTNFSKAKGDGFTSYYYWTSSEMDGSSARHVGMTYNTYGGDTKTGSFYVRAILAF